MRLWSIHPKYLDTKGLVALWREGLLAQKVLMGETRGYRHHPQLTRFKSQEDPVKAIGKYLEYIWLEANNRGYNFNYSKIVNKEFFGKILVSSGQLSYEFEWLRRKLIERAPRHYERLASVNAVEAHPLFEVHIGHIAEWEVIK